MISENNIIDIMTKMMLKIVLYLENLFRSLLTSGEHIAID